MSSLIQLTDAILVAKPKAEIKILPYDSNTGVSSPFYHPEGDYYGTYTFPEIVIKPLYKDDKERLTAMNNAKGKKGGKYVRDAIHNYAFPIAAPIVAGAALPAVGSTGFLAHPAFDATMVAVDPSDPLGYLPFAGRAYKIGKLALIPSKRAAHVYANLPPVGYNNRRKKAGQIIKSILTGKDADITNPTWDNKEMWDGVAEEYGLFDTYGKTAPEIARRGRIDAYRKYLGLPEEYNIYLKNSDGSFRYNLEELRKLSSLEKDGEKIINVSHQPMDFLTSAGGNLSTNQSYGDHARYIEDVWDLHPFSRPTDQVLAKVADKATQLFGRNYGTYIGNNKFLKNISDKIANMEAGPILGGKPFTMKTIIPYERSYHPAVISDTPIMTFNEAYTGSLLIPRVSEFRTLPEMDFKDMKKLISNLFDKRTKN